MSLFRPGSPFHTRLYPTSRHSSVSSGIQASDLALRPCHISPTRINSHVECKPERNSGTPIPGNLSMTRLHQMSSTELVQKVEDLSDLELALLLCFVANEHCLIWTEEEALDSLQRELQLVRDPIGFTWNPTELVGRSPRTSTAVPLPSSSVTQRQPLMISSPACWLMLQQHWIPPILEISRTLM